MLAFVAGRGEVPSLLVVLDKAAHPDRERLAALLAGSASSRTASPWLELRS